MTDRDLYICLGGRKYTVAINRGSSRTMPCTSPREHTMTLIDSPTKVDYLINDADEHSTPRAKAYEDYIDPDKRDMAIRTVRLPDGTRQQLFNGRPPRFTSRNFQVTFADDTLSDLGVSSSGRDRTAPLGDSMSGGGNSAILVP